MPKPSQPHNAVHIETLGGLQLSASQEVYAENAYKLRVLSNETAEVRALFISVTMAHALIIFLGGHTASLFI